MSDTVEKKSKMLAEERVKRMNELNKTLSEVGKGLLKDQIEIKQIPWRITWERQEMMLERQERIIELLEKILKTLEKGKR